MSLKYFLAILACIFSFSLLTFSSTESLSSKSSCETNAVSTNNWVLEYHDSSWWWVLYDIDGSKIMEIPVEF